MGNFITITIIVVVLIIAIRPLIKMKKENGTISTCYSCSQSEDKKCCGCDSHKKEDTSK